MNEGDMLDCIPNTLDRFRCPTKWELFEAAVNLLPPGRAWQNHEAISLDQEAGPYNSQVGTFELNQTPVGAEPTIETLSVLHQFWATFAEISEWMHQRACALLEEFFCATTVENRQLWEIDYGFPDPCEHYAQLCDKVAAKGGATCAYLASVAATRGWSLSCSECPPGLGDDRAGNMVAGCNDPCACPENTIYVTVTLADSSAYVEVQPNNHAGIMVAGCNEACPPSIEPLFCLIERIRPAHVKAIYEVI